MRLSQFSVEQPVLINVLMAFVMLAGLAAFTRLPKEMFPVVDFDMVQVFTAYPGASPEEVETIISIPVENAVRTVDGLDVLGSTSVEGRSVVLLSFLPGERDMDEALLDVRTEVSKAKSDFPDDVEDPDVSIITRDVPVITVVLSGPVPERTLNEIADDLEDRLMLLDGVSSINTTGDRQREVTVEIDPQRLRHHGLALSDVEAALRRNAVNLPLGMMKTEREEVLLRLMGEYDVDSAAGFRDLVVGSNDRGQHIRLGEVAAVDTGFREVTRLSQVRGNQAITMDVRKKEQADSLTVIADIKALVAQYRRTLPATLSVELINDRGVWIERRLGTMYQSAMIGLVLVLALLLVFLNWRIAALTALGMPFAFLATILCLAFFEVSFNMISMFGFIVVLGMIVDDAIVIVENCYRYLEMGYSPREAAIRGASEVIWPVCAAVTTTIVAFAPLMFIEGLMGKFMLYIPLVVILALAMSLVEALIVLPSHFADWGPKTLHAPSNRFAGARARFQRGFAHFLSWYVFCLKHALRRRYLVLGGAAAALVGATVFSFLVLGWEFMSMEDSEVLRVAIETPTGTKIEETARVAEELAAAMRAELRPGAELRTLTTEVGLRGESAERKAGANVAQIVLEMEHHSRRGPDGRGSKEIENVIRRLAGGIDNLTYLDIQPMMGGPPTDAPISLRVRGDDLEVLRAIADDVKSWLKAQPGVEEVRDDMEGARTEYRLTVDRAKAWRYGVSVEDVARAVRTGFSGATATEVQRSDEEVKVVVKLRESSRRSVTDLLRFELATPDGATLTLRDVATVARTQGLNQVRRRNQKRTITVTADLNKESDLQAGAVLAALRAHFAQQDGGDPGDEAWSFKNFPGYSGEFGGEFEMTQDLVDSLSLGFPMALFLIYLILAAQFKSYVQPMIVMTAIPFGFIGVVVGFSVFGLKMGFLGVIGMVALSGIVVNDSLVLVDFINRSRRAGADRWLSIMRAGKIRMRPIILTTLTTLGGLGPMALGFGGADSEFLAPMALAICWGLSFGTVLTLVFVPCSYAILDDVMAALSRLPALLREAFTSEATPAPMAALPTQPDRSGEGCALGALPSRAGRLPEPRGDPLP